MGCTTHSPEEALVLFWLLSVFLGQQSMLPGGLFALVCLTKAPVPALVLRLSAGPRMVVPVHLSSWESQLTRRLQPGAAGLQQKPLAFLCYLQNEAGDKEGVIKAPMTELSQAELCSPAQLC